MIKRGIAGGALVSLWVFAACSSSSTTSGGAVGDGGSDAATEGSAPVTYPAGPYGIAVGDVFPNVSWTGAKGGSSTTGTIAASDYFDPDGSRGIRGVLFTITVTSAGCGPCTGGAKQEETSFASAPWSFGSRGARFVDILVQNWSTGLNPSTTADIAPWVSANGITFDVVIDPVTNVPDAASTASFGVYDAVPTYLVIDPRSMKVTDVALGANPAPATDIAVAPKLDALLVKNGATEVAIADAGTD